MRAQTKVFYWAFCAVLLLAAPSMAEARPGGYCFGSNSHGAGWRESVPQEKHEVVWQMMREHRKQTQELRDRLWVASRTLEALEGNSRVEPKEIRDLVDEIGALRAQLREQRKAFVDKVQKDVGVTMPLGDFAMWHGDGRDSHGPRGKAFRGGHSNRHARGDGWR